VQRLVLMAALCVGLTLQASAQRGALLSSGGGTFTVQYLEAVDNSVAANYDTTGLANIPPAWRNTAAVYVEIGDAPPDGGSLRGYTFLNNKTGYISRFDFYLLAEDMAEGSFCTISVGKEISPLVFYDASVDIAWTIRIAKVSGERKIQVLVPTDAGEHGASWTGVVGLQTPITIYNDYNLRTQHHLIEVEGETVVDRDLDGSAIQSIGTLVLGSSGGSTCRDVQYLIGRVLETPITPTPFTPSVLPSTPTISSNSPANGATNVPIVGQSLGCTASNAVTYDIYLDTVNPPVTQVVNDSATCGYALPQQANGTTFYWRATPTNASGSTTGTVWSYATVAVPTNGDLDLIAAKANCADSADNSPTGRNPNLLWTCARQEVWDQMVVDFEATGCSSLSTAGTCSATPATEGGRLFKVWRSIAMTPASAGNPNHGQYNALVYQATGDAGYITNGTFGMWKKLTDGKFLDNIAVTANQDVPRIMQGILTVMFEWTWPALSEAQRLEFVANIDQQNDDGWWRYGGGHGRTSDPDQTIMQWYFPIALMKVILPNNVSNNAIWDDTDHGQFASADCTTVPPPDNRRDGMCLLFTVVGDGSEYLEGPMYGKETIPAAIGMALAVSNARGVDTYPEITTFLEEWVAQQSATYTPDLLKQVQFVDEQFPNILLLFWNADALRAMAGALQGTAAGERAQQLLADMITTHGETAMQPTDTKWWGSFLYNPYATAADWKTSKSHFAPGMGTQYLKSGYTSSDSLFFNHCPPRTQYTSLYATWAYDHEAFYFCAPKLYKNGEWVVDGVGSYAGASNFGEGQNVMRFNGFSDAYEYKQIRQTSLADTHAFMAATTGGAKVESTWTGIGKPPIFLNEGSRATLHVPGAISTIVIHDRASVDAIVDDTTDLQRYVYNDCSFNGRRFITQQHARQEWLWHIPVDPTVASGVFTWTTPVTKQLAKLTSLLPAAATRTVYDLATTFAQNLATGNRCEWHNSEIHAGAPYYYTVDGGGYNRKLLKIWPETMGTFHTYLHVFQVGASTPATPTLITNSNAECAHVVTTGQNDILACFNGTTSTVLTTNYAVANKTTLNNARLRTAGAFTVAYTAVAATTELHLADLDPTLTWTYNVDAGGAVTINAAGLTSTGGYARISLALAAGAHSIVVTGS
jgi:hypothetical protein